MIVLSPELRAVLVEAFEAAQSQLASMENGMTSMDSRRVAILEKMLDDLTRVLWPDRNTLH